MLSLHEMSPEERPLVMSEVKRVLKNDGRILLIDYHPGPYQPMQGWFSKIIILFSELAAGREHFKNYRNFLANGALSVLTNQYNLSVEKQQILAGGTFAIYLVSKELVN